MSGRAIWGMIVAGLVLWSIALPQGGGVPKPDPVRGVAATHTPAPKPMPPNDGSRKVVDFRADVMRPIKVGDSTFMNLIGNVILYHNGAIITCDSAIRYNDRHLECFGRVVINKDSTYIYGDRAEYKGEINTAFVFAPIIKMTDGNATLYTYNFTFNTLDNIGKYSGGGTMRQDSNLLESKRGFYYADLREMVAVEEVELRNPDYKIRSDSAGYNLDTEVATFHARTYIWNVKDEILRADRGYVDRKETQYRFTRDAYILTANREIWADSIDYNSTSEDAILRQNIQMRDDEQMVMAFGDYGEWWGGPENALLTLEPSIVTFDPKEDSLFMRSDSMFLFTVPYGTGKPMEKSEEQRIMTSYEEEILPEAEIVMAEKQRALDSLKTLAAEHAAVDSLLSAGGEAVVDSLGGESVANDTIPPTREQEKESASTAKERAKKAAALQKEIRRTEKDMAIIKKRAEKQAAKDAKSAAKTAKKAAKKAQKIVNKELGKSKTTSARMEKLEELIRLTILTTGEDSVRLHEYSVRELDTLDSLLREEARLTEPVERPADAVYESGAVLSPKPGGGSVVTPKPVAEADAPPPVPVLPADTTVSKLAETQNIPLPGEIVSEADTTAAMIAPPTVAERPEVARLRRLLLTGSTDETAIPADSTLADSAKIAITPPPADSTQQDSVERVIRGYHNVRIFRNDFQAVCDSLVGFSIDSTFHLYIEPVLWNNANQITSEMMTIYTKNQQLDRAVFIGDPIMIARVDSTHYNQIKGKTMESFFRNNDIYRTDVNGNGQTYYYMEEEDYPGEIIGFLVAECADITFIIAERKIETITWRGSPVYSIFPMDKIPPDQEQFLPGFQWLPDRRPTLESVFTRTIRDSERAYHEALSQPVFPLTDAIMADKERMIRDGIWVERNDQIGPEVFDFIRSLGYR